MLSAFEMGTSLFHNAIMVRLSVDASITQKMIYQRSPIQQSKGEFLGKDAAVQSDCPYSLDPSPVNRFWL